MAGSPPSPGTTLVLILGASEWPHSPQLGASGSFRNSAQSFKEYLLSSDGLAIPEENLLDLFDSKEDPSDIDLQIGNFLDTRIAQLAAAGTPALDLLLYYVGHGGFTSRTQEYFLAIRSTRQGAEGISSLRISDLAGTLISRARSLRRFLILDSCFSASAYTEFMSAPLTAAHMKTLDAFPTRGTALLCSSGSKDPSKAPQGAQFTMFSGALLEVLDKGDPEGPKALSLAEVGIRIEDLVREQYPDSAVRPEVHVPDQRFGNVATFPFFPNRVFQDTESFEIPAFSRDAAPLAQLVEAQPASTEVSPTPESEKPAAVAQDRPVQTAQAPERARPWPLPDKARIAEASRGGTRHFWGKLKHRRATLSLVVISTLFLFMAERGPRINTPIQGIQDNGNFNVLLSGLVALVPRNNSTGANHMTALLLDARIDPANSSDCFSPYKPYLKLETSAAQCMDAGCTVSGPSTCTCELHHQEVSIGPDVEPPKQLLTKKPSSILPNKESFGDFSYITNLAQSPLNQTLNPQYLGPSPPSSLIARMTFPFESITACAMSTLVNEPSNRVLPMGFGRHAKEDLMVQAVAQGAVATFKPAYSATTVTISSFDGSNFRHLTVRRGGIHLANERNPLPPESVCAQGDSQDFALFYELALNPPPWKERPIPRLRHAQGNAGNFKIPQCRPFDLVPPRPPIIPLATFNP